MRFLLLRRSSFLLTYLYFILIKKYFYVIIIYIFQFKSYLEKRYGTSKRIYENYNILLLRISEIKIPLTYCIRRYTVSSFCFILFGRFFFLHTFCLKCMFCFLHILSLKLPSIMVLVYVFISNYFVSFLFTVGLLTHH